MMLQWVLALVFASALLFFMIWPATLLADGLSRHSAWLARYRQPLRVLLTVLLAVLAGATLQFA